MKLCRAISLYILLFGLLNHSWAENYVLDSTHSFVEWRVKHLGYSWLYGRFNDIQGSMTWDEDHPDRSRINVTIKMNSIDSNHVERDKHLKGKKYLDVKKYPTATFTSTAYRGDSQRGEMEGELNLNGVTKIITLQVERVGEGKDPWGGYRVGFISRYVLDKNEWGFDYPLGPESDAIELELGIEGIRRQKHKKR